MRVQGGGGWQVDGLQAQLVPGVRGLVGRCSNRVCCFYFPRPFRRRKGGVAALFTEPR